MNSLVKDIQDRYKDILLAPVSALKFTVRTENCLATENIKYVADLVRRREVELLRIDGFGNKSINEVKEVLANCNLSLDMKMSEWPPEEMELSQVPTDIKGQVKSSLNYALRVAADKAHANCVSNDPDKAQAYVGIVTDILWLLGELKKP
jgi:DNA-directed RNA polymerase subunit alpha